MNDDTRTEAALVAFGHVRSAEYVGGTIETVDPGPLAFDRLAGINAARCNRWHHGFPAHGPDQWTGADWSNAMMGEAGEAANIVKKLRRMDFDLPGNRDRDRDPDALRHALALELADTVTYADLLATYYGIDLGEAIIEKFNLISEREGFPERLP